MAISTKVVVCYVLIIKYIIFYLAGCQFVL